MIACGCGEVKCKVELPDGTTYEFVASDVHVYTEAPDPPHLDECLIDLEVESPDPELPPVYPIENAVVAPAAGKPRPTQLASSYG